MRGSGRGRRLNLDFPSSSNPGSLSPSWIDKGLRILIRRLICVLSHQCRGHRFLRVQFNVQNFQGT